MTGALWVCSMLEASGRPTRHWIWWLRGIFLTGEAGTLCRAISDQTTSSGSAALHGVTKQGNRYLRSMLTVGALEAFKKSLASGSRPHMTRGGSRSNIRTRAVNRPSNCS